MQIGNTRQRCYRTRGRLGIKYSPISNMMRSLPVAGGLMILSQLFAQENLPSGETAKGQGTVAVSSPSKASLTASLTKKDVLSIKNGRFFLDGGPFAEISFNKYDLFWQLYDQLTEGKQLNM